VGDGVGAADGGGGSGMQRQLISLVHELLPAVCMYKSSWSK
jgi:hypothetical protein